MVDINFPPICGLVTSGTLQGKVVGGGVFCVAMEAVCEVGMGHVHILPIVCVVATEATAFIMCGWFCVTVGATRFSGVVFLGIVPR